MKGTHGKNRRVTRASTETYMKFLKPGALAHLRDSKISARLLKISSNLPCSSARRANLPSQQRQAAAQAQIDALQCFSPVFRGPRCLQRKKMFAVEDADFLNLISSNQVAQTDDSVVDSAYSDAVVAH